MQILSDATRKALPASADVRGILGRHILADGFDIVLDMEESRGARLRDATTGRDYIDFFTFYASNPLGMNHPGLAGDSDAARGFRERLMDAALNKVADRVTCYNLDARAFVRRLLDGDVGNVFFLPRQLDLAAGAGGNGAGNGAGRARNAAGDRLAMTGFQILPCV